MTREEVGQHCHGRLLSDEAVTARVEPFPKKMGDVSSSRRMSWSALSPSRWTSYLSRMVSGSGPIQVLSSSLHTLSSFNECTGPDCRYHTFLQALWGYNDLPWPKLLVGISVGGRPNLAMLGAGEGVMERGMFLLLGYLSLMVSAHAPSFAKPGVWGVCDLAYAKSLFSRRDTGRVNS